MISLQIPELKRLLVLGCHCDDIEIGCGGALLHLVNQHPNVEVLWVTFSGNAERQQESAASAAAYLDGAAGHELELYDFRDGYFPWEGDRIKDRFEQVAKRFQPDLIFTHYRHDRHQDHRMVSELTWNTFRNHLVLEYEIPKWEGDLAHPNLYIPLSEDEAHRKVKYLMDCYATQRSRDWFSEDLFLGLMRIRGVECRSPSGFAEAFHAHKAIATGTANTGL